MSPLAEQSGFAIALVSVLLRNSPDFQTLFRLPLCSILSPSSQTPYLSSIFFLWVLTI